MKKYYPVIIGLVLLAAAVTAVFFVFAEHEHTYASAWTSNENGHWHAATCGCSDLTQDFALHAFEEGVVTEPAAGMPGNVTYTCAVCGYTQVEMLRFSASIVTMPKVAEGTYYVGQTLQQIKLLGGEGSVSGKFIWAAPQQTLLATGEYAVHFVPDDAAYETVSAKISIIAQQLTLTVTAAEHGTASSLGTVNAAYGEEYTVYFTPDFGFEVADVVVDGVSVGPCDSYTFDSFREDHTVQVSFRESESSLTITCTEGDPNGYTIQGNTILFSGINQDSIYQLSGQFAGNIVIDIGENYRLELELRGFSIASDIDCPISVRSGDQVTITAKKGFSNAVFDHREAVHEEDYTAAIDSQCDLVIGGKGSLRVLSVHNNGIHSKDDLKVKNLSLSVDCVDNALKGNDSVTVEGGSITLIARQGDGIKTSNSNISAKGNQRGTIRIAGAKLTVFAACDGIDAAYDVIIDDAATEIHVFTDQYSPYSETVENAGNEPDAEQFYICFTSKNYQYAVQYYNSDADFQWVFPQYHSSVAAGRSTYYFYSFPILSQFSKIRYFGYTQSQTPGQDEDYAFCTDYMTVNSANDTFALSQRGHQLSYYWTNYAAASQGGMGPGGMGPGGMQDGNTDKGDYSTKGIKAANSITISAGTIQIEAYDDAIHATAGDALENGETGKGDLNILGGSITIKTNDDGLHADGNLVIDDGTITIADCYEGIEATTVAIHGGTVSVISSDDGINGTATSGQAIVVSGGYLYIYAGGDGLDANSQDAYTGIVFSGGKTVVITASNGNSAIDTERGYQYSGGYVLAVTSQGGMSRETLNCQNLTSVGTSDVQNLYEGSYLTVSVDGESWVTLQMPCSVKATAVFLGSTDAKFTMTESMLANLNGDGVYWYAGGVV